MIDIHYVPNVMGAPAPLHRWQQRVLQRWQDQEDEE